MDRPTEKQLTEAGVIGRQMTQKKKPELATVRKRVKLVLRKAESQTQRLLEVLASPPPLPPPPQWHPHLDLYQPDELTDLVFSSDDQAKTVISLLWTGPLRTCPHDITPKGIRVPTEAVLFISSPSVKFTASRVEF